MYSLLVVLVALALASGVEVHKKPIYKYRYETEDVMKTAASTIPIHGYHVVEGGYYPIAPGIGGGIGGGQFIGAPAKLGAIGGGFGAGGAGIGGGFYPGIGIGGGLGLGGAGIGGGLGYGGGIGGGYVPIAAPIAPIHHHHHPIGGEYVDKSVYSGGKKNANDEHYEKVNGKKGEEISHGESGFKKGEAAIKNAKGESAYFQGEEADKKAAEDEKVYHGGHHFNQEAKNAGEKKEKKGHKKGHIIKGFKSSHHKDETGKTEEYYDEENDEGSHFHFNGEAGQFGKKDEAAYKGGHENEQFHANKGKKEGHHESHHLVDNANADHGQYGSKKFAENGAVYGVNNGIDQQSLLGHQESSRFFKHHPHVPIY